jgi:hypothetical protein
MSTISNPCLVIDLFDHEVSTEFAVNVMDPPDWSTLQLQATVTLVRVRGNPVDWDDIDEILLRLAVAIKPHPGITAIHFYGCSIGEISALYAVKSDQLMTYRFTRCSFEDLAGKTMLAMLQGNSVGELEFNDCTFDVPVAGSISHGLSCNQSLRTFEYFDDSPPTGILNGVKDMLNVNQNILKLGLAIRDGKGWDTFREARRNKSLECLEIRNTHVELHCMEAILIKFFGMKSLKELQILCCTMTCSAMEFLVDTLNENKILDTLTLESINIGTVWWANTQVSKLSITGLDFDSCNWGFAFNGMINNPFLQCVEIDLDDMPATAIRQLCDALDLNRGPSQLNINVLGPHRDMLIEMLQRNTRITSLAISCLEETGLVALAQGLALMRGLRKLDIHYKAHRSHTEEFFSALVQSLEANTTLETLILRHVVASRHFPRIRYLLAINRMGRYSLLGNPTIPVGLWPHVLGRSSKEADGLYFVLTGKPEIVKTRNRKRKSQNELKRTWYIQKTFASHMNI